MKHVQISLLAALSLLAAACTAHDDQVYQPTAVTIHTNGFTISQEDFPNTKSDPVSPGSTSVVNAVTLAFYDSEGNEQYKSTQLKSDPSNYTTFGTFNLTLPMGAYTMVAIAHTTKEESPFELTSLTSASYTGAHAFETFSCTQAVNIENTNPVELSATLSRVVSMLSVISSDTKTANAARVRMTLSAGGKSFNPTTGLASVNTGFSNTVGISATVGASSTSSTCLFLATDEQTMNVTIEVLDDNENVLYSKTVQNVPFKRNRKTKLTGKVYSSSAETSFLLSSDWLTAEEASF